MVQIHLVLCVVDEAAFCATSKSRLRFKPTCVPAQSNGVKVLTPNFDVG